MGFIIWFPTAMLGHGLDRRIPMKADIGTLQPKDLRTRHGQKGQGKAKTLGNKVHPQSMMVDGPERFNLIVVVQWAQSGESARAARQGVRSSSRSAIRR